MNKEGRRSFIKRGFLVLVGGIVSFLGLRGRIVGRQTDKELSASKEAMHWRKLAG